MLLRAAKNNGLVSVALALGDSAVVPGSFFGWRSVCLLIRCAYLRGCFGCCGKIRAPCILFSLIARKRGPPWQRLREMHAFRAEAGRIFVPCIRFGVQSGDFGYIARESCQGGPFFCVEVPGIMHGAKILPTLDVARASPLRRAAGRGRLLV